MLSPNECWFEEAPPLELTHEGRPSATWNHVAVEKAKGPILGGNVPRLSAILADRIAYKAPN